MLGVVFNKSDILWDITSEGVWEVVDRLEVYSEETITSILTVDGERYINRAITKVPYKGVKVFDFGAGISKLSKVHPRLIGVKDVSDENVAKETEFLTMKNWKGKDGRNIDISDAKNNMDYVKTSQEINNLKENVSSSALREVGGINLNPNMLHLKVRRNGAGVPLPIGQQPVEFMQIDGFVPVIIQMMPIQSALPMLLGILEGEEDMPSSSASGTNSDVDGKLSFLDKYRQRFTILESI